MAVASIYSLQSDATRGASTLPPLLLQALKIAATIDQGVHGRRRTGTGDSFWQFRSYHWGDDLRRIDWRQSAKSDRLFLRQMEWDAAQSAYLWCDLSPSMRYRSRRNLPDKSERAIVLCLALCHLLVQAGERIAYWNGETPPMSGRAATERLARQLETDFQWEGARVKLLPPETALPAHAQVVLFSDFFIPLEEIAQKIHHLAEAGIKGHLMQITDPAEDTLPFEGRIRFYGTEGEGNILFSKTENIREAYLEKLKAHREALKSMTRNIGWHFTIHRTDQSPNLALLALHQSLSASNDLHQGKVRA